MSESPSTEEEKEAEKEPVKPTLQTNLLVCVICTDIFVRPTMMPCCGQTFCRPCVLATQPPRCPFCRAAVNATALVDNVLVRDMVAAVPLTCTTCGESVLRGEYVTHERERHAPPPIVVEQRREVPTIRDTRDRVEQLLDGPWPRSSPNSIVVDQKEVSSFEPKLPKNRILF